MPTISDDEARRIADDAEIEWNTGYSGRFMYGATCLAFVGAPATLARVFIAAAGYLQNDRASQLAEATRVDNMASDPVFYFPGWTIEGTEDDQ